MKKTICLLLAALLLLTGCQSGAAPTDPTKTTETTAAPTDTAPADTIPPETTVPETQAPTQPVTGSLSFSDPGKVRIGYEGQRSYARYITCVQDLPNLAELVEFDDAFFADHALLLVVETVASGSVQLELDSITLEGSQALVSLKRSMQGEVGTSDMATWLLWAVVDKDLDYTWGLKTNNGIYHIEKA